MKDIDFEAQASTLLTELMGLTSPDARVKRLAAAMQGKFYQGKCVGMVEAADKLAPGVLE